MVVFAMIWWKAFQSNPIVYVQLSTGSCRSDRCLWCGDRGHTLMICIYLYLLHLI